MPVSQFFESFPIFIEALNKCSSVSLEYHPYLSVCLYCPFIAILILVIDHHVFPSSNELHFTENYLNCMTDPYPSLTDSVIMKCMKYTHVVLESTWERASSTDWVLPPGGTLNTAVEGTEPSDAHQFPDPKCLLVE